MFPANLGKNVGRNQASILDIGFIHLNSFSSMTKLEFDTIYKSHLRCSIMLKVLEVMNKVFGHPVL